MKRILILLCACALVAAMLVPDIAHACPNCKDAYLDTDGASVAGGFNASILFMMSMPFLLLGGLGLRIWLSIRRKNRLQDSGFTGRSN